MKTAAYPEGQCAEASAIGALVRAGGSAIAAVRVEVCPPCGGGRRRLAEFASAGMPVYLGRPGAAPRATTVGELLPLAFDLAARGEGR